MRLIDADAFKEYLKNAFEEVKHVYTDGGVFAWRITEDFCRDIDEQPTINAEPEHKKGEWIPVTKITTVKDSGIGWPTEHVEWVDATEPDEIDAVRCSECGEVFDFEGARNWCTECGTDMRGEQE